MAGVIFTFKCPSLHLRRTAFSPSSVAVGVPFGPQSLITLYITTAQQPLFKVHKALLARWRCAHFYLQSVNWETWGFSPQRRRGLELCILWYVAVRLCKPFLTTWPFEISGTIHRTQVSHPRKHELSAWQIFVKSPT